VLAGDLDHPAVTALSADLLAHVTRERGDATDRTLVLDLTDVSYLASAGVRLLLRAADLAAERGRRLQLRRPPHGIVARVLQIGGVGSLLRPPARPGRPGAPSAPAGSRRP